MRHWLVAGLALAGGMLINRGLELRCVTQTQAAGNVQVAAPAAAGFEDLASGKLRIVDLAWPLNRENAFWPGDNYKPFELHTIATLEKDGVLSKAFCSPEHLGTHLDAPNHFERQGSSVDQIPPAQLFGPGVVIDISAAVSNDPDYRLSLDDVRRFEQAHGQIPRGAVVLAYTGWGKFWKNRTHYQNSDAMSRLHFPGYSAEAVQFLIDQRQVRGVGLDTMSVDYGLSRDFVVHHVLGKAGRYGLENLAQLDKLPARGFFLFVAPMKIETGSGGPTRVFAVLTPSDAEN
ncbi:MAG: cyclase family protein [Planctomycetia bacterium]|nr:cyclase family protein [Planctomycetia bacterium]